MILIDCPGEAFGCSLIRMLEVVAWIPFQYGVDTLGSKEFMQATNADAYLRHHRILRLLLLITKAEIDGMGRRLVRLCVIHPSGVPNGWRHGSDATEHQSLIACPHSKETSQRIASQQAPHCASVEQFHLFHFGEQFVQNESKRHFCPIAKRSFAEYCRSCPRREFTLPVFHLKGDKRGSRGRFY